MNRRNALKTMAVAAAAVTSLGAYDKTLITNTKDIEIKDPAHLTEFEAKHLPDIKIGEKDTAGYTLVEVTIGQQNIIHPSTAKHWIYEIELFADDKLVGKVDLEPVTSRGYLGARVKLDDVKVLKSISRCNLHGNFIASVNVPA